MIKNIIELIDFIKNFFNLKEDIQVAKMLHLSKIALYNHKRRGTIPYKAFIKFCTENNISLDEVFGITPPSPLKLRGEKGELISEAPPTEYAPRLRALIEKMKVIYDEGTSDEQFKLRGVIENIIDDINERKEKEARKAHAFPENTNGEDKSA